MTITERLNKGVGTILGAFTGLLIPFCQVGMSYYSFGKSMREINPEQNWLTTILLTGTLGTINALVTAGAAFIHSPWSVMYGMREGFRNGVKGAVTLPYVILGRISESIEKDTPKLAQWNASPFTYMLNTLLNSLFIGSYSITKLFIEPYCLDNDKISKLKKSEDKIRKLHAENVILENENASKAVAEGKPLKTLVNPATEAAENRILQNSNLKQPIINSMKSDLLNDDDTRNNFLLDAFSHKEGAILFLKQVCLAIADMTKEQQKFIINILATKANEYVIFRSNLESLKIIMEQSSSAKMFAKNGQIAEIIKSTLTLADQLKPNSRLSATNSPPSTPRSGSK